MSCYFIANIKIHDCVEYQQYLDSCTEIFAKYNGEYLVVDQNPVVLEGEWQYERVVVIRFPKETDLRRWYDSPEYQRILQHRLSGAKCDTIIAHGLNAASASLECRVTCGACCIAPSISSPIPGMPGGKPAGVRCVQLTPDNRCKLFGKPERPTVCLNLKPSQEMCGNTSAEALSFLAKLEKATQPD